MDLLINSNEIVNVTAVNMEQIHLFDDNFKYAIKWVANGETTGILWYPLFYLFAFFTCVIIGSIAAHWRYKVSYDLIIWYTIILVPTCLLGARFWSACIGDLKWENFFTPRTGGLAIQGGIVVGVIDAMIFFPLMTRKAKYQVRIVENDLPKIVKPSFLIFVDCIIPLILIGQAIGRWGNFFNGELFGRDLGPDAASLQWLTNIMPGVTPRMQCVQYGSNPLIDSLTNGDYYQPLFLYEGVLNILAFLIIYIWLPNYKDIRLGTIGMSYFWIYGCIRFGMEPLRNSQYTFTSTYILNGILCALGIAGTIYTQFFGPKYRDKQLLYMVWIKYIRLPFIKLGIKMKMKWALQFEIKDKGLKNYGFEKPYNFCRSEHNPLYYANR